MKVVKRDGTSENISFDKILQRLENLCENLNIDCAEITQKIISGIYDGVTTAEIDERCSNLLSNMTIDNLQYGILASRIIISNHHKKTSPSFSETIQSLYNNVDVHNMPNPLISKMIYDIVLANKDKLNTYIKYERDYNFDYFAFRTLERSYLLKIKNKVIERPQQMLMRVSLGIHSQNNKCDIKDALETYDLMSQQYFTHATPTLFNSGTPYPQMSSCFLLHLNEDSISGIYSSLAECAQISKFSGGIGINMHEIRAKGSIIRKTNGRSDGLVPCMRVFNETARYVNQAGKRNGSIAIYLAPWHADIESFLDLKKNHGNESERARDLFYALWINDLFMQRVENDEIWSLMDPDTCPGLSKVYGKDFVELYEKYEAEKRYLKQLRARIIWDKIIVSQIETGVPYMLYADACNEKSNQKNIGTITSSNLCVASDTLIFTDKGQIPIKELKDQTVKVWNGKEFSETIVKQTGKSQKLIEIQFDNNLSLKCTPYHKFYIETASRPADKSRPEIIEASQLKEGMRIIRYEVPILYDQEKKLEYAYTNGLFAAEGTYAKHDEASKHRCNYKQSDGSKFCKRHKNYQAKYEDDNNICCAESFSDQPRLSLYGVKKLLLPYVDNTGYFENKNSVDVWVPHGIKEKTFVPINYDITSKLQWLEGLVDGDGCVNKYNGVKNIQISSIDKTFLQNVFYMLQTLGINTSIGVMHEKTRRNMPDGKGGSKLYDCNKCYRLGIDSASLIHLIDLGFSPKRLDVSNTRIPHHKTNKYIRVNNVIDNNEIDDTYCFNEPNEHKGIFNGILTGQCAEILEFTSPEEIAVCNLSSICLPKYIIEIDGKKTFDHRKLGAVTKVLVKNLNKIIDNNYYPLDKAKYSNLKHRPIAIGVSGLADLFVLLRIPFDSEEAIALDRNIAETMYYYALQGSMEIAKKRKELYEEAFSSDNNRKLDIERHLKLTKEEEILPKEYIGAYSTFVNSPAHKGVLQYDMWNEKPSDRYDWDVLKKDISQHGLRNSLLLALMPTATTSAICGVNECFEMYNSMVYKRKMLAGEFTLINRYLVEDLEKLGLWNADMKDRIILEEGSVQNILEIPEDIRALYKTTWDVSAKVTINHAAARGPFIDQTQSMNLFVADVNYNKLSSAHFYAWKKGLKTGVYYVRTKTLARTQNFTIDPEKQKNNNIKKPELENKEVLVCSRKNKDNGECLSCGA